MKRLPVLLFFAARVTFPQASSQPTATGKFEFRSRLMWYTQRTYTDPWQPVRLIGDVTVDDFVFGGTKRWGSGVSGWGKALSSVWGQRVIDNTAELLLGTLVGDDARYRSSEERGVVRRSLHAIVSAFTARARSGNTRPAYSRTIAITAGTLIANQWRSDPRTGGHLTRALVFGVTDKIQEDLLQEFSPDLKRFGHRTWREVLGTLRRFPDMGP
jgi:hypothetical protein